MGDAKKVKAAIYDPYLDTFGGGERYAMSVAHVLKKQSWDVCVVWDNPGMLKKLGNHLGIDLSGVHVLPDIGRGSGFDLIFWLSDGSVPLLFGKKNILHFQTPFRNVGGKSFFNRLKLLKINTIVCNSRFTKSFIDKEYGVESVVIYPPVDVDNFEPEKKENIILYVGRFSQLQQNKGQDVLIKVFKKMYKNILKDWKLVLIGGSNIGTGDFVQRLKSLSRGYPVDILENLPFDEVRKYYAKAKIFWSASGYGVDENTDPQKTEHFGIVVVEAQAAGCVPVILNTGGHKEIVGNNKNGILWNSIDELIFSTEKLVRDEVLMKHLSQGARENTEQFSQKRFEEEILKLVGQ